MSQYKCIIIGMGSIGGLKPKHIDSPLTQNILTHAHAIVNNPELKLVGIVETNTEKRMEAVTRWNCEPAKTISCLNHESDASDIVVAAVPTDKHLRVVKDICDWRFHDKIKILIIEKPFGNNLEDAKQIITLCKKYLPQAKIICNYSRRFSKLYHFGKSIFNGEAGKVYSVSTIYVRGLLRDGCHAIDFFNLMLGKCTYAKKIGSIGVDDYSKQDRTIFVSLSYAHKCNNVCMIPMDGRVYDIFETDIHTEAGRFRIIDHGKTKLSYRIEKEKVWGDLSISNYSESEEMHLELYLENLYMECVEYLNKPKKTFQFSCTEEDALNVHEVYKMME
jgi:predicted dehydrogenase